MGSSAGATGEKTGETTGWIDERIGATAAEASPGGWAFGRHAGGPE
jgi:hypothetical protein